jgi:hypothetical protein
MPRLTSLRLLLVMMLAVGCSSAPERFMAPKVDTEAAAAEAIELYDASGDGALSREELIKCPGMLSKLAVYDQNNNSSVEQDEIAAHLGRLLNRTGGTQLTATVMHKGRPLSGATVVLEPEPYLGDTIRAAQGVTNGAGSAELGIPPEFVPEHLKRIKSVHYGTFKVRITHPSLAIPAKYNTETELGYETEPGKPLVQFNLK